MCNSLQQKALIAAGKFSSNFAMTEHWFFKVLMAAQFQKPCQLPATKHGKDDVEETDAILSRIADFESTVVGDSVEMHKPACWKTIGSKSVRMWIHLVHCRNSRIIALKAVKDAPGNIEKLCAGLVQCVTRVMEFHATVTQAKAAWVPGVPATEETEPEAMTLMIQALLQEVDLLRSQTHSMCVQAYGKALQGMLNERHESFSVAEEKDFLSIVNSEKATVFKKRWAALKDYDNWILEVYADLGFEKIHMPLTAMKSLDSSNVPRMRLRT